MRLASFPGFLGAIRGPLNESVVCPGSGTFGIGGIGGIWCFRCRRGVLVSKDAPATLYRSRQEDQAIEKGVHSTRRLGTGLY